MPSYPEAPAGYAPPPGSFPPPSAGDPASVVLASWGLRLGGWLIDTVIFAVVEAIFNALLRHSSTLSVRYTMMADSNGVHRHGRFSLLALLITILLTLVYATVLVGGSRGQTIGMMAVGVRAVRDGSYEGVGYGKAFGRALLEEVLRITVIIGLLDGLFPLWDPKRQTLHDKAAGTVVLRVRNAG
jgi:uncharacterized RDD family membrane protein YckC